jgi:hypothetical protein
MTYHEELEAEIAALHRKVWELEYQLEACRLALGINTIPAAPPRLFKEPTPDLWAALWPKVAL